jgi:hypothetical protein
MATNRSKMNRANTRAVFSNRRSKPFSVADRVRELGGVGEGVPTVTMTSSGDGEKAGWGNSDDAVSPLRDKRPT